MDAWDAAHRAWNPVAYPMRRGGRERKWAAELIDWVGLADVVAAIQWALPQWGSLYLDEKVWPADPDVPLFSDFYQSANHIMQLWRNWRSDQDELEDDRP